MSFSDMTVPLTDVTVAVDVEILAVAATDVVLPLAYNAQPVNTQSLHKKNNVLYGLPIVETFVTDTTDDDNSTREWFNKTGFTIFTELKL
jgi:hypothetical protein